jgi:hypothetical protein
MMRAVYSLRAPLIIVIAVLTIAGGLFLGFTQLYDPGPNAICSNPALLVACPEPSRYAWQIPVAIVIGVVGFGVMGVLTFWRRPSAPAPPRTVPSQWQ